MPKKIITDQTLTVALKELDKWLGKLSWDLYAKQLAKVLGEDKISRHTLLSYPALVSAFNDRKKGLKEESQQKKQDSTLEHAVAQITMLEAKVRRLEKQNALLLEQFARWQYNAYMTPQVDMKVLNSNLDKPLPKVDRR